MKASFAQLSVLSVAVLTFGLENANAQQSAKEPESVTRLVCSDVGMLPDTTSHNFNRAVLRQSTQKVISISELNVVPRSELSANQVCALVRYER